jgi:hypothetical protein
MPLTRTLSLLIVSLLLASLAGCSNADYFEPTPLADTGHAMVYIYRPAAGNPGKKPLRLSYPEVMVDGHSQGMLKYNSYLALELEPGRRDFVVTGLTRDSKWEPKDRSYTLELKPGESYFMRFGVEFDTAKMSLGTFKGQYIISLHPVDRSEAVYEIRHTDKSSGK